MTTKTWDRPAGPIVSIRIPGPRADLLGALAVRHGVSRSELVRRALATLDDDHLRRLAAEAAA